MVKQELTNNGKTSHIESLGMSDMLGIDSYYNDYPIF
jgi:hypothetical protein